MRGILKRAAGRGLDLLRRQSPRHIAVQCKVCQSRADFLRTVRGRRWYRCPACDFLQMEMTRRQWDRLHVGEGFTAGTGQSEENAPGFRPGTADGGYREWWLAKELCHDRLSLRTILLYGTGNTGTFARLRRAGVDAYGCDFSRDLVAARRKEFGEEHFFHPEDLPDRRFDAVIAVEVFEHFASPMANLRLLTGRLAPEGVLCGTTDLWDGSDLADHRYLLGDSHVAYWSERSLSVAAGYFGLRLSAFELVCPGSVKPDEKFGLLWPRKRVFFLHPERHSEFFRSLKERQPILPIDKP